MAYVSVPKDLTRVKSKVIFNLTKRQIVCFGGGALIGVPLFFWLRPGLGSSPAAICMMLTMLPFLLLGLYQDMERRYSKQTGRCPLHGGSCAGKRHRCVAGP